MSKKVVDAKSVKDIQERRRAHKEKMKKYPEGKSSVYLQVVGTGAKGAPKALYVFTESCRYLFNCGEGTQRLAYEHKVKLSKMEHILITHKSWENVGGLPGTILTLQDTGVPDISIHGPPDIDSLYFDTKSFMNLENLKLNFHHYEATAGILDGGPLIICYIPLRPSPVVEIPHDGSNLTGAKEVNCSSSEEKDMFKDLTIIYICRPIPKPGRLLANSCELAGVPNGPLRGLLKDGNDVTLPNGNIVKSVDVREKDEPGPVFIVMEIPNASYLPSLLKAREFEDYQEKTAKNKDDVAQIIIHFSPPEVVIDQRYQDWINCFPCTTSHLYLNENNSCTGSERVHKVQHKLNHLYAESFPLLADSGIPLKKSQKDIENGCDNFTKKMKFSINEELNEVANHPKNIKKETLNTRSTDNVNKFYSTFESCKVNGEHFEVPTLLMYHIRPLRKLDFGACLSLDSEAYINECYEEKTFEPAYREVKKKLNDIKNNLPLDLKNRNYPNLLFLGTGSCIPNKTRNTSGIALNISESSSLLLDCGEGTYGQLVRFLGIDESDKFLKRLKGIYVSHKHADHHIGLIRLLLARKNVFWKHNLVVPTLYLLAPSSIVDYLKSYDTKFEPIFDSFTFIPNHNFNHRFEFYDSNANNDIFNFLEVKNFETCLVWHCKDAYGVAILLKDGYKLVYSGDTKPCQSLVNIGENCDLLIHEATMEDELSDMAELKKHSTTSGAIKIATDMNATYVILTHFSQRYAKVPLLKDVPNNVSVAFDNMLVHLRDLPCLPCLYPAYVAMFSSDYDEMVEKTRKRKVNELKKNEINLNIIKGI